MTEPRTVLVVGAHPDDEVLGAGGTIAKHANAGDEVHVLIVTEGASQQYDDETLIDQKVTETQQCAETLGVEAVHHGDLPDMRLDAVDHVEINSVIESVVESVGPDVVYTHSPTDVNKDHQHVYDSTLVATRPNSGVQRVLSYEVPSSTNWTGAGQQFDPSVYVDITETLERKLAGFAAYESEHREYPHPRSAEAIEAYAKMRGTAAGYRAAEAFQLVSEYRGTI